MNFDALPTIRDPATIIDVPKPVPDLPRALDVQQGMIYIIKHTTSTPVPRLEPRPESQSMQNVLARMVESARSRGHNNAYVNAYTVQNLYYDLRAQEAGRNVDTTPQLIPPETYTSVGKARHLKLTSKRDVPPADGDGEPQLTEPCLESLRSQKKITSNTTRILKGA